jgi:hypothetical protein
MERKTRAFEDAAKLARAYLESKCPKKKHKSTVEKWLKWFDGINKPAVALTVVIVEAQLADNAKTIYDPLDPPDVEITLELSTQAGQNQQWKTPVVNDSYTPRYNVECRNVMVSWNDRNAKLTLTLIDKDTAFHDELPTTFQGPDVIFLLDGWVWVQDGPGRHHIRFSCEQLQPPTLPEYGNNPL